ncbi:hypothetical protein KIS4809_2589 [Bacillus sp. ZZV12-4809]|nr:hypothetical protein KIS4809_2589 [Bacillus sp. ZZV12-4809]
MSKEEKEEIVEKSTESAVQYYRKYSNETAVQAAIPQNIAPVLCEPIFVYHNTDS